MSRRANGSGTLYRRNGVYYAKVPTGKGVMRVSLGTRKEAEARRRLDNLARGYDFSDEERLAALERHLRPRGGRLDFEEAWEAYVKAPANLGQSATARANNRTIWDGFLRWLLGHDKPRSRINCKGAYPGAICLADITEKVAGEFAAWLKEARSAETVNKYLRVLKRVWALAKAEPNPWEGFRKLSVEPRQRRALTQEEVERLIDEAKGELKVLFAIGAYTGMRMGDCAKARWETIEGDRMMVRTGKTKRLARLPIHRRLAEMLDGWAGTKARKGYILPKMATWPEWKVSDEVMAHFRKLGFEQAEEVAGYKKRMAGVGFHSLRSTFITRLAAAGVPLAVVREMVGHVSEEMSQRYFRADEEMARKAIEALG